jgi:hypothetical protein
MIFCHINKVAFTNYMHGTMVDSTLPPLFHRLPLLWLVLPQNLRLTLPMKTVSPKPYFLQRGWGAGSPHSSPEFHGGGGGCASDVSLARIPSTQSD